MWRSTIIGALAVCVSLAAAPLAHGATQSPRDALSPIACHQALDPAKRRVSVAATMRPVAGTERLQIRFNLTVSVAGAAPTAVVAAGLGQWLRPSDPTLGRRPGDIWKLSKPVTNLGRGSYRFAVAFRWLGKHGKLIRRATLATHRCSIKELRADLAVRAVKVRAIPALVVPGREIATRRSSRTSAAAPRVRSRCCSIPGSRASLADALGPLAGARRPRLGPVHRPGVQRLEPADGGRRSEWRGRRFQPVQQRVDGHLSQRLTAAAGD